MRKLVKSQYEMIAQVLSASMQSSDELPEGIAKIAIKLVTCSIAERYADVFASCDSTFKRSLFLKQCGVVK